MEAYSFTAGADYRMYAATMTGFSGGSADTLRDFVASDGTMMPEDGCAIESPASVAGAVLPTTGAYYVRARRCKIASLSDTFLPCDFYVRVLWGSPIPEMEPNYEGAPQATRSNGRGGRVIGPATAKNDSFAITVNGRDTIGVIVAVDLERGAPVWNAIAGTGVFTGSFIITL